MVENRRIQHIVAAIEDVNPEQIAIDPYNDLVLGVQAFGYQDTAGNAHRILLKDKPARVQYLSFLGDTTTSATGRLWWSSTTTDLMFGYSSFVKQNIGQELLLHATNSTGALISKGALVTINGVLNGTYKLALADKDTASNTLYPLGIAAEDIADGSTGFIKTKGVQDGLNLSAFSDADVLWLGDSGSFMTTQPNAPAMSVRIGGVLDDDASNGKLYLDPQVMPNLFQLSDVDRSVSLYDKAGLRWDTADERFELVTLLSPNEVVTSLTLDGSGTLLHGDLILRAGANIAIVQNADGFTFSASTGGTAQAALAESAVGYGDSSNELTGDATNFTWDAANRQLLVGNMTPAHLATTNDSLGVLGNLEVSGESFFDDDTHIGDSIKLYFGADDDTCFEFDTVQTADSMMLWLPASNIFAIAEIDDIGNDLGAAASSYPRLTIYGPGAAANNDRHFDFYCDGDDSFLRSYVGGIVIRETHLGSATNWTSNQQKIYANSTEVESIYTLLGNQEGSLAAAILAAASVGGSGGTLDDAYDFGGAGAGKSITVDSGAVSFTVPSGSNHPALALTTLEPTATSDLLPLYNDSAGNTIYMDGDVGTSDFTSDGHIIGSNGSTKYKGEYGTTLFTHLWQYASESEGIDYPTIELYAQRSATEWSKISVTSGNGEQVDITTTGSVILEPDSSVYLRPGSNYIYCDDSVLRNVQYLSFADSGGASFATNTLTLDMGGGSGIMEVDLTANCTSVTISTNPIGWTEKVLFITASGASRLLGGFPSSWGWNGNYDLYAESVTIPSGTTAVVRIWYLSTGGYRAQFVSEV